jgi:nitrogen regulatory protein PII
MLDYLGLEKNEKVMMKTIVTTENARTLMNGLVTKMGINLPGTGIAITIPVGSVAGNASLMYLAEGQKKTSDEVTKMSDILYALVTVICEKGCSGMVMDAAREAGAGGGTVMHGKGTATEFTAKFFGVSIAAEKEIIYIVTKKSDKDAIMKSIIEKAGPTTEARAAAFSIPVEDVVGLCSVTDK